MTFVFVFIKFVDFNIWDNIADKRIIFSFAVHLFFKDLVNSSR